MRAVFGLLLIMLGLAMAVVWMPEHNGERQLAVVTDIATQGIPRRDEATDRNGRTFSPNTPLLATVEQPNARQTPQIAATARVLPVKSVEQPSTESASAFAASPAPAVTTTIVTAAVTGASVVAAVTAAPFAERPTEGAAATRSVANEMSRYDLVRSIQRELKRVGCYWGDIDGDWGTGSRRAMSNFTDRVNASLPIEQPDFILLTLLQGHQATACGKTCPAGQSLADAGRCLPNAVLVQARRSQDRRAPAREETPQIASLGAAPTTSAPDSGWTTRVARAPATAAASSDATPVTGTTPSNIVAAIGVGAGAGSAPTILPGRMAAGGPPTGSGAYIAPPVESTPARAAVRAAEPEAAEPRTRSARRERAPRRVGSPARGAPAYRYSYAPPVVVYRAPRQGASSFFGPAPRRAGRSWTATFFSH